MNQSTIRRALAAVQCALQIVYVGVILVGKPPASFGPGNVISGDDSRGYIWAAHHWPWERTAAQVAPLMPAVFAAVGGSARLLVLAQTAIAIVAWQFLAGAAARTCRRPVVATVAFTIVLCLSLVPEVIIWNVAIGSESLAISTMVAGLAAVLTAVRRNETKWWLISAVLVALSVLARDTFAINAIAFALGASIVAVRRAEFRRICIACTLICVAAVAASQALAERGDPPRWFYPVQENIVLRVLPDPNLTSYFVEHGLPQVDGLRDVGRNYFFQHLRLQNGAEFEPFRTWLRANGESVYLGALIRHPKWAAAQVFDTRSEWIAPVVTGYTAIPRATPGAVYGLFGVLVFWRVPALMFALFAAAAVALAWRKPWTDDHALRVVLAATFATASVHVVAAVLGDVLEIGRHTLAAGLQLRLATIVVFCVVVDRLIVRGRVGVVVQ